MLADVVEVSDWTSMYLEKKISGNILPCVPRQGSRQQWLVRGPAQLWALWAVDYHLLKLPGDPRPPPHSCRNPLLAFSHALMAVVDLLQGLFLGVIVRPWCGFHAIEAHCLLSSFLTWAKIVEGWMAPVAEEWAIPHGIKWTVAGR